MIDRIRSLGSSHVMRLGADTADAVCQKWHLLHGTSNTEAFKAAQFRDLEVGVGDVAFIVQKDLDLAVAFEAGDGVNCNSLCHG